MKWKLRREPSKCDVARCEREWQVSYQPKSTSAWRRDRKDGLRLCDTHHATLIDEDRDYEARMRAKPEAQR